MAYEDRGGGGVKKAMPKLMEFYEKAGMKTVSTQANITVGSYIWAKFGFSADSPSGMAGHQAVARARLDAVVENVDPSTLTPQETEAFKAEKDAFISVLNSSGKNVLQALSDLKSPVMDRLLKPTVGAENPVDRTPVVVTVTQHLMNSNIWNATLLLSDKTARARLLAYANR